MSKFISIYHRSRFDAQRATARIERILHAITPDIAREGAVVAVRRAGGHLQGTLNLPESFPRRGLSLCQGKLYGDGADWWVPGSGVPDGSYALIRESDSTLEAVSDPAGSRSLWHYLDDDVFAVSNSQRAITMYTGRFDFDLAVVPWIVSTGSLGVGNSYNRHLRLLPPASTLALDKARWTLRLAEGDIRVVPQPRSHEEHLAALEAALSATFASFDESDRQISSIALSGGVDSRVIACLLSARDFGRPWQSFTGGRVADHGRPDSDVFLADKVARHLGTEHRYFPDEPADEPAEAIIQRFILSSEGRIDHLWNYLEGMATLRALAESGTQVIIRGDQGFGGLGGHKASSPLAVRKSLCLLLCGELGSLAPHLRTFDLDDHQLPLHLVQREGESLQAWKDRLVYSFYLPTVLTALNESKTAFVDVVNPLLSRRALEVARSLPDPLRSDKALFRAFLAGIGPDLPFARPKGGLNFIRSLRALKLQPFLQRALTSDTAERCFGPALTDWVRREIDAADRLPRRALRKLQRSAERYWPGRRGADSLRYPHPLYFAVRIHIAATMVDRLTADAAMFAGEARLAEPGTGKPGAADLDELASSDPPSRREAACAQVPHGLTEGQAPS